MIHLQDFNTLESLATKHAILCGSQTMTWRVWGSGSPAILLHGSVGSWTHWVRNIGALAERHTVYVPDLPGYGDSDLLLREPTFDNLSAAIWSSFDALCPRRPDVALVGFSFGSVLAECMALARNDQVRRILLLRGNFSDKTPRPPAGMQKWRHLKDAPELAATQRHNLALSMFHDHTRIDDQAVSLHIDNCNRSVADHVAFFPSRPVDALKSIAAEVHGIAGEFDCYGLPDLWEQGRALLDTRPDARFHLVPQAGHWTMYEAPETVNQILLESLAS
ncbi:alpha/beta fold hydrolase [Herbaspirillum sp. GCM10030257]|uniref:alpha/beta fold hydrolase n=1 Tax=Herbaspirillum sp. GCM10030257 TaxID=3273393 RepID=UPI0036086E2C